MSAAAELEQLIAGMSNTEFDALVARVRAPDTREQLREIAQQYVPAQALDEFIDSLSVAKFVDDNGRIDVPAAQRRFAVFFHSAAKELADLDADMTRSLSRGVDA